MWSSTVTVATQLLELPLLSVTVKVTLLAPTWEQSKEVCDAERDAIPQASEDPLKIYAGVIVATPFASSCMVMFCNYATGAVFSSIVLVATLPVLLPLLSVTVKVTLLAPT